MSPGSALSELQVETSLLMPAGPKGRVSLALGWGPGQGTSGKAQTLKVGAGWHRHMPDSGEGCEVQWQLSVLPKQRRPRLLCELPSWFSIGFKYLKKQLNTNL